MLQEIATVATLIGSLHTFELHVNLSGCFMTYLPSIPRGQLADLALWVLPCYCGLMSNTNSTSKESSFEVTYFTHGDRGEMLRLRGQLVDWLSVRHTGVAPTGVAAIGLLGLPIIEHPR